MTVAKYFNIPDRKLTDGDLGVEVEVEGCNLPRRIPRYWNTDYDGSLKGEAYEYVLAKPLKKPELAKALVELDKAYLTNGSVVNDSVRCGVHVHVNVQKLTITQLYNFFTLYSLFEGPLLHYCGKGRDGNLFCLPLNKSPQVVYALREAAQQKEFRPLYDDAYRYCAMNVKALGQYGSLEFRALRGGPDLQRVYKWAELLQHLRDVAMEFKDPCEIIESASLNGHLETFKKLLGDKRSVMFKAVPNIKRKLQKGARNAAAIAFATNWADFDKKYDPYPDFY